MSSLQPVLAKALAQTEVGCWATGARHSPSQDDEVHARDAGRILRSLAADPATTEAVRQVLRDVLGLDTARAPEIVAALFAPVVE